MSASDQESVVTKPSGRDLLLEDLLSANPEVMSGRTVFRGTRVPLEAVIDNLAGGQTLEEVLDDYPTLDRRDVLAVLRLMEAAVAVAKAA